MKRVCCLVVAAIAFSAPAAAQNVVFADVGFDAGGAPRPYGGSCASEHTLAAGGHGGIGVRRDRWQVSASYMHTVEIEHVQCSLEPLLIPDGVYTFRRYTRDAEAGLRTLAVEAGYSPGPAQWLLLHAGGGFEIGESDPMLMYGATVRTTSRNFRVSVGARVLQLRTPYADLEQEWKDHRVVRSDEKGSGSAWRRALLLRIGLEFPLSKPL